MTLKEMVQKQIVDLEDQIKILSEKIDYCDSKNQPVGSLGPELSEKQAALESLKKFVSNQDASL